MDPAGCWVLDRAGCGVPDRAGWWVMARAWRPRPSPGASGWRVDRHGLGSKGLAPATSKVDARSAERQEPGFPRLSAPGAKGRRVPRENGAPSSARDRRGTCRSRQGRAGKLASGVLEFSRWHRHPSGSIRGHASPLFVSHARRARGPTRAVTDSRARPSLLVGGGGS